MDYQKHSTKELQEIYNSMDRDKYPQRYAFIVSELKQRGYLDPNTTALQESSACPICSGCTYSWGFARGHYEFKYKDDDVGAWEKTTVFGGEEPRARRCHTCGNIQLFIRNSE